jgi:quinol monooxygenase YgiN
MDQPESVVVVAHWQTTQESLAAVLTAIAELLPLALAEPGCTGYEAFQQIGDPTHLLLVEHYRDANAQDAHVTSAHYRELVVERIRPLLTARRVEVLHPGSPH